MEYLGIDLDWFFIDKNNLIGFVASGGGPIPKSIVFNESYSKLENYLKRIPDISDYSISKEIKLKSGIQNNLDLIEIFNDFIFFAKKGIFTFDKSKLNDFVDNNYDLVIKPTNYLTHSDLPCELKKIIGLTKINIDLSEIKSIKID